MERVKEFLDPHDVNVSSERGEGNGVGENVLYLVSLREDHNQSSVVRSESLLRTSDNKGRLLSIIRSVGSPLTGRQEEQVPFVSSTPPLVVHPYPSLWILEERLLPTVHDRTYLFLKNKGIWKSLSSMTNQGVQKDLHFST